MNDQKLNGGFDIEEYKEWFKTIVRPDKPIKLTDEITIYNIESFVYGRLTHIKAFTGYWKPGNRALFIEQLRLLREELTR